MILHVIHSPTCKAGLATPGARQVPDRVVPDEALPHEACLPGGFTFQTVLLVAVEVGQHEYQPGNYHPIGSRFPWCRLCRNPRGKH